jgi:ABC-type tungstate transport system permease subunit
MINLNNLSKKEILELEKQLQEYKKTEKFLTGYKVTFCVKFNPETHKESDLNSTESFADWLCDVIPNEIIGSFNLNKPESVSLFNVEEMIEEDEKYLKCWTEWDN